MSSTHTLITVAPTGAETAKSDAPALPVTLEELVATGVACEAAGAALIHVHIRDADARPTLDVARLSDTVAALREATSLVVQLSTGGSVHDPLAARLAVLDAEPDSCSLTCGTVNFGEDVFLNPWPFMVELYQLTQAREVVPEFELFDLGQVHALNRLLDQEGLPYGGHVHCDLVMGVPGGMPGTAEALVAAVQALPHGGQLVRYRRGPFDVARGAGSALSGGSPAGRHGRHPDVPQGRAGPRQRPAGRARCRARHARAATTDDDCSGSRTAPHQGPHGGGRMTQPMANGRRRIDRVLAEDFLDGLGERSLDEVRALRHDAEQEEADLSYVRRLLQGRMDLVRAEQARRGEEGSAPLIDLLAQVLADGPRSDHGSGRFLTVEPSRVDDHRRKVEQIVSDVGISDVAARSDAELQASLDSLAEHERMVSGLRRRVQTVMDALTAEITRRYRDGEADVSTLLSPGS